MLRPISCLVSVVCTCALALCQGSSHGVPGDQPGTERWVVHFEARSFDLSDLASAIRARRPADEVSALVQQLDSKAAADQAEFVEAARGLGATVVRQWWIINACAVDVAPGSLSALRELDNVVRLERDHWARPGMLRAASRYNHDVAGVHAAGHQGAGVTVAIMDGGADIDMNGSGRPHATYYRDGNPMITAGSGIAGSRLVVCRQIGAAPSCDDATGHGTQVASIAAGAAFGPPAVGDGHAPKAQIASYGIADQANGAASGTTMVSAWQAITADVALFNIVAANNSYQGVALSDPIGAVQMALDSAVLVSDIVVTAIAGNQAVGAPWGHACVNGLAVGAVEPDAHHVVDYSGRGPQSKLPLRNYPDIAACTHVLTAPADCETSGVGLNGTSAAAPQVAGAAALVRSVAPGLAADQVKALLLATATDISGKNPSPPYNTPNAYGAGLLHDSTAVLWAKFPALQARGVLDPATPTWRFGFQVNAGQDYTVAIAWHRTDVTNTSWSNLDLKVLDGFQVVGSSSSPRNLHELVRFVPASSGTYTAEVSALSLQGASQAFGLAISAGPWRSADRGDYRSYGLPCSGTGEAPPACVQRNGGARPTELIDWQIGGDIEYGFDLGAVAQPASITGLELLGAMGDELALMTVSVYRVGAGGLPEAQPVATGTDWLSSQPGWHRFDFSSPYQAAASERLVVGLRPVGSDLFQVNLPTGSFSKVHVRGVCNSWTLQPQQWAVGARLLCGPAAGAEPHLYNDGVPELGAPFGVRLSRARPAAGAVLLTGGSRSSWYGLGLPISLGFAGATGCSLLASGEVQTPVQTDGSGSAAVVMQVPALPALVDQRLYQQWLVLDPGANALGLVLSAGGEGRVGN